jgi:hypothetical protein
VVEISLRAELLPPRSNVVNAEYINVVCITSNETPLTTGTITNQRLGGEIMASKAIVALMVKLMGVALRKESHCGMSLWKRTSRVVEARESTHFMPISDRMVALTVTERQLVYFDLGEMLMCGAKDPEEK